MIKYNWEKIKKLTKGNPKVMMAIISLLTYGISSKEMSKYIKNLNFRNILGDSFLINPESLLTNKDLYMDSELVSYVHLASLRNLASYKLEGEVTLPLLHADIHEKYIKQNRLLEIVGNKIHFKYED